MAIDISREKIITLNEAARLVPTVNGKRVHVSSVWRWALKGVGGVHLEYGRLGRRIVTSHEAMGRFMNALASKDAQLIDISAGKASTRAQHNTSIRDAEKILKDHGVN